MSFTVTIDMDSAAFEDEGEGVELARIIRLIADDVELVQRFSRREHVRQVRDINGDTVGEWTVAP